jgi:hypothetical protein
MSTFTPHFLKKIRVKDHLPSGWYRKTFSLRGSGGEGLKVVVAESKITALRRCAIHLLPILTSTTILVLNLHGHYIGQDFRGLIKSETINIMLLQVAAKLNELIIVASLGLIILHMVRHELLFGDGLPLGLIGSGLTFSNFQFFFRKEFYGALSYLADHGNKLRKVSFVGILIVAGLTAVLAGPASAVLLVPKSQVWPSGGTEFFLNGSPDLFWPDDLSGDISELQQYCSNGNSANLAICPGGGFFSLLEHWGRMDYTSFNGRDVPLYAKNLTGSHFYWPVYSPASQIPPRYVLGDIRNDNEPQSATFLVQPHAASAAMLQRIAIDWWKGLISQKSIASSLIDDRIVKSKFRNPITYVRCSQPQNISTSDKMVQFPTIDGRWTFAKHLSIAVESFNATAVDHLRFQWIHLPGEFGAVSIGAVFESPWSSDQRSRVVIGCSAQAGWVPATVSTDEYSFWSGWYPWGVEFGDRTPSWVPAGDAASSRAANGRIALGNEWLNMLTPPTPARGHGAWSWQPSTVESILENAGLADSTPPSNRTTLTEDWIHGDDSGHAKSHLVEAIICSIIVDGLSRSGSHKAFNTTGPSSQWSIATYKPLPDFNKRILADQRAFETPAVPLSETTTLNISMEITGFAFRHSLAGFLAMAVLLTHIAMATIHIIWVSCNKRTSRSWSTVSELVALSQNSQPAFGPLSNTGAGIHCSTTFASIAKIRVKTEPGSPHLDRVELVFLDPVGASEISRAPSQEAANSQVERQTRSSQTWPPDPSRLYASTDLELGSRSSSTQRLIPRVRLADQENGDSVRVNHKYG